MQVTFLYQVIQGSQFGLCQRSFSISGDCSNKTLCNLKKGNTILPAYITNMIPKEITIVSSTNQHQHCIALTWTKILIITKIIKLNRSECQIPINAWSTFWITSISLSLLLLPLFYAELYSDLLWMIRFSKLMLEKLKIRMLICSANYNQLKSTPQCIILSFSGILRERGSLRMKLFSFLQRKELIVQIQQANLQTFVSKLIKPYILKKLFNLQAQFWESLIFNQSVTCVKIRQEKTLNLQSTREYTGSPVNESIY